MKRLLWVLPFLICVLYAEEETLNPSVLFTHDAQKEPDKEKPKPHFAGARRSAVEAKKKRKKIKNPWFLSKTYPKKPKEEAAEEDSSELTEETPYFIRIDEAD